MAFIEFRTTSSGAAFPFFSDDTVISIGYETKSEYFRTISRIFHSAR